MWLAGPDAGCGPRHIGIEITVSALRLRNLAENSVGALTQAALLRRRFIISLHRLPQDISKLPDLTEQRSTRNVVGRSDRAAGRAKRLCHPRIARIENTILPARFIPIITQGNRTPIRVEHMRVSDELAKPFESGFGEFYFDDGAARVIEVLIERTREPVKLKH